MFTLDNKFAYVITRYWLPLGLLVFCSGLFFMPSRGSWRSATELLLMLPSLVSMFVMREYLISFIRHNALLFAFLTYALLSMFWAVNLDDPVEEAKHVLMIVALFWAVHLLVNHSRERFERLLWVIIITSSVGAAGHLFYYYVVLDNVVARSIYHGSTLHMLSGQMLPFEPIMAIDNTLEAAMLVIPQFFMLLALMFSSPDFNKSRLLRFLGLTALVLLAVYLLALQRRSAFLAIVVTMAVLAFARGEKIWKWSFVAVVLTALGSLLFFPEVLLEKGASGRFELWGQALRQAMEDPLFGHGLGARDMYLEIVLEGHPPVIYADPHNLHLGVFYYFGISGLLFWLALWLPEALKLTFTKTPARMMLYRLPIVPAMVTVTFIHGEVIYKLYETWFSTWLVIAILYAFRYQDQYSANAPAISAAGREDGIDVDKKTV